MKQHPLTLLALAGLAMATPVAFAAEGENPAAGQCSTGSCPPGATTCSTGQGKASAAPTSQKADYGIQANDAKLQAVHDCKGINVCKGLGGCKISAADLAGLAAKRNVPVEQAGTAHDCAGLNSCKGLGGCKVSAEKFVKLFEKRRVSEMAKP